MVAWLGREPALGYPRCCTARLRVPGGRALAVLVASAACDRGRDAGVAAFVCRADRDRHPARGRRHAPVPRAALGREREPRVLQGERVGRLLSCSRSCSRRARVSRRLRVRRALPDRNDRRLGCRLRRRLRARCPGEKFLVLSDWARHVLHSGDRSQALGPRAAREARLPGHATSPRPSPRARNRYDAFVIVPCSVSTLAKIAVGIADTLITRAAAVALKERMRMVLCVRETPLSTIALENCVTAVARGCGDHADLAAVVPASGSARRRWSRDSRTSCSALLGEDVRPGLARGGVRVMSGFRTLSEFLDRPRAPRRSRARDARGRLELRGHRDRVPRGEGRRPRTAVRERARRPLPARGQRARRAAADRVGDRPHAGARSAPSSKRSCTRCRRERSAT